MTCGFTILPLGREMVTRTRQRGTRLQESGLDVLAQSALGLGAARTRSEALQIVADAAARAAQADVVVVRVADGARRRLNAAAVATASTAVAAELEGSWLALEDLPASEESDPARLPAAVRGAAERVRAPHVLMLPLLAEGEPRGSLELLRSGSPFGDRELQLARLAAAQAGLAIRAFGGDGGGRALEPESVLALTGNALAAAADEARTAEQVTRLAAEVTGAVCGLLWELRPELELVASFCLEGGDASLVNAGGAAERALQSRKAVTVEQVEGRLPAGAAVSATLHLGQPPVGALQLLFAAGDAPTEDDVGTLATFAVRAAHALRASSHSSTTKLELERTRALLGVVAQAISELSLAHTLETAVARVAELLDVDRVAVYLRDQNRLYAAAGIGLAGPHVRLAERLLELTLGPFRSRGLLTVNEVARDPRLASVGDTAAEAGIEAVTAVPLLVRDEVIGLLAVFPPRGRSTSDNESALLAALAAQLAVAVQNAQLHEQSKRLGEERERALDAERAASKQVSALYEISRSFAQSLSLEATLNAVASTVVDVLDADVALIRMPDERRELLLPRAMAVADPRLDEAVRSILFRPQPFGAHPVQQLFRLGEPFMIDPVTVEEIGGPATALVPFLQRGWTGAAVAIATPAEVLASLTILSTRPGSPVSKETIEQAAAIGGQAALAIDNARLYQQQKEFADTMQRSLLPHSSPTLQGLELGDAYESSARVEVGGDVYDYMELPDGRLAVALGDVTGHGIEAAADMAMAKFVFRSLAREHPEPGDFLQSANEVVCGEIAPGKFITMVYLVIDGSTGAIAAAGAGHPPPRIVAPDGSVSEVDAQGLVLGIEGGQSYDEVRAQLEPGSVVVLYTDGVIEARRDSELYGAQRLDSLLAERRELPPALLAQAVLDDCRAFAAGELTDDCAVVVVKRTG
jgi:serine phosphatase RsbU (regulator of sigma subunit)